MLKTNNLGIRLDIGKFEFNQKPVNPMTKNLKEHIALVNPSVVMHIYYSDQTL